MAGKAQRGVEVTARRQRSATVAVALALAFLIVGCTSSKPTSPSPTTASSPPTPSATTASTPQEEAKTQVLAMLPTYFRTINELYNDPKKSPNDIYLVATDPEASAELKAVNAARVCCTNG